MSNQTGTLTDAARQLAQSRDLPLHQQEAFRAYEKMAEYLDRNFPPVVSKPLAAVHPVLENGPVWERTSTENVAALAGCGGWASGRLTDAD